MEVFFPFRFLIHLGMESMDSVLYDKVRFMFSVILIISSKLACLPSRTSWDG